MIKEKYTNIISIISIALIAILILVSIPFINKADNITVEISQPDYVSKLFNKDKVSEIDIMIDDKTWQDLLDNAIKEEYYNCDISINGEVFSNVGIRAKGNSSLSMVANDSTTDRYSFKIDFGEYIKGQSYYGLDKLALNNNISDATSMKEYLSYEMFSEMGIPTPGFAYSNIKVNGKEWGLYLAVEVMEESFIERYYGNSEGNLYKPEGMELGGNMNFQARDMEEMRPRNQPQGNNQNDFKKNLEKNLQDPKDVGVQQGNDERGNIPNNMAGPRMGMGGNSGTNLVYINDDISSYSGIFDNAIFKTTGKKDKQTLVNIIKNLNDGVDLEKYIDVDEVLRYFSVNTFLVNLDSYAGSMKHNYYIYERDGQIQILPWDLNLSFAGHEMSEGNKAINFPIDNPVTDTMENSPLISKLLEVDEYKEIYREYLEKLVLEYINSDRYEASISKVNSLIGDYIKNDPTAFYTYEEYKESLPVLLRFGKDRADSIIAQLNGQQPSTTYGTLSTNIDLSLLGSMNGMGEGRMGGMQGSKAFGNSDSRDMDTMRKAMEIIIGVKDKNNLGEEEKSKLKELGLTDNEIEEMLKMTNPENQNGFRDSHPPSGSSNYISYDSLLLIGGSTLSIIIAYIFVFKFKRRKYKHIDLS